MPADVDVADDDDDVTHELWIAAGLEAALRARAPGVHASTPMVRQLAVQVSRYLGLGSADQTLVDVAARVRDIGMLALPDSVVLATGPLSPRDWEPLSRHPSLGAELLQTLPAMAPVAPIVRSHHERWDGEGYPDGLRGEDIPLLSRVIAACDALVAIASDRPHRRGIGAEVALEHLSQQREVQFDARVVDGVFAAIAGRTAGNGSGSRTATRTERPSRPAKQRPRIGSELMRAIAQFDVVPAFGPACERACAAAESAAGGELVAAIEGDTGLTIAVLRRGQAAAGRSAITNVSDAVAALEPAEILEAIRSLPRAAFPWRTQLETALHHHRTHAQAVARAAHRIGRELTLTETDDLLAAALLHDVGRLALARYRPDYPGASDPRTTTPEQRLHQEVRTLGIDHASLGGLLLTRWGLHDRIASTVAAHHRAEAHHELATFVRLSDMVAHHAQGEAVDRKLMLRLAYVCGLAANALRDVLFDLPHSGGSERRRAQPSPLSARETAVLRQLAQGKVYKEIASDLDLSISTVRSHLHKAYTKLQVPDRAQAVLRATEMAWI